MEIQIRARKYYLKQNLGPYITRSKSYKKLHAKAPQQTDGMDNNIA